MNADPSLAPLQQVPKTNGLAVTALVLGCLSIFGSCITGILAIIFGHVALSKIKKSGGQLAGSGLALAGLIMGYIFTALSIIYLGLAVPAVMKSLDKANVVRSIHNTKQIKSGLDLYAENNAGSYPPSLSDLIPTVFSSQAELDSFTENKLSSSKKGKLIYVPGYNQTSSSNLIILYLPSVNSNKYIIARIDGSVHTIDQVQAEAELTAQGVSIP